MHNSAASKRVQIPDTPGELNKKHMSGKSGFDEIKMTDEKSVSNLNNDLSDKSKLQSGVISNAVPDIKLEIESK